MAILLPMNGQLCGWQEPYLIRISKTHNQTKSMTCKTKPTRQNHMGEQLLPTNSAYTEEQIAEMNRQHDRKYGWSPGLGNIYTNSARRPESYYGKLEHIWNAAPNHAEKNL